jgi:NitT/TauT family transport system substrate-binding protein
VPIAEPSAAAKPEFALHPRDRRAGTLALLLFLAVIAVLLAISAGPPPQPPLKVAMGPWLGYDPLILQRERDALPSALRLVELGSATDVQTALRDGRVEAAAVTLDEALRLQRHLADLRVVAVLSESRGADGILLRSGLDPAQGLRGRRVLVEDSAVGGLMLAAALEAEGLQPGEVQVTYLRVQHLERRWVEGAGDVLVAYEPLLSRQRAAGDTLLRSTRDLPGLVYDVLVARESARAQRATQLDALLAAWSESLPAFQPPDQLPLHLLLPGTGLDARDYRSALAGIDFFNLQRSQALLTGADPALVELLPRMAALLRSRGELIEAPTVAGLFDPAPQQRLQSSRAPERQP